MSIEAPEIEVAEESKFSKEEVDTALSMIEGDEFLKKDSYARRVVENDGMLDNGVQTSDFGNFLAARRAFLMSEVGRARFEGLVKHDPSFMIVSSAAPEFERYLE